MHGSSLTWIEDDAGIDWQVLAVLYRRAPLGDKKPADLRTTFGNSMFKRFVFDDGQLVGGGRCWRTGRHGLPVRGGRSAQPP